MSERKIMIGMWTTLIVLLPLLIFGLYQERSEYSKQCADANGTLIATKTDYICVKTKALIPLK
jgi:hypothetical protein